MKELHEEVSSIEKQLNELEQRLSEARQKVADKSCPFKIGDIVDNCGYTHRGFKIKIFSISTAGHP